MSTKYIQIVFWDGTYRQMSSQDMGTMVASRAEAMDILYDRIASGQSPIGYINNIYDNAQVEMDTDNMEQVTVEDYYSIQGVYGMPDPPSYAQAAASLSIWSGDDASAEVGMMYALKRTEGSEPDFNEYLQDLKKRAEGMA